MVLNNIHDVNIASEKYANTIYQDITFAVIARKAFYYGALWARSQGVVLPAHINAILDQRWITFDERNACNKHLQAFKDDDPILIQIRKGYDR